MLRQSTAECVRVADWSRDIPGKLSDDGRVWLFPSVFGQTASGKTTEWLITVRAFRSVADANADCEPILISRDVLTNANMQGGYIARILVFYNTGKSILTKVPTDIVVGKRAGGTAETNIFCQALRDAYGLYNKHRRKATFGTRTAKQDAQVVPTGEAPTALPDAEQVPKPAPMLAKRYEEVFADESSPSPIYIQRKFNGVRAIGTIINGAPEIYSRSGIIYEGFPKLRKEIALICNAWNSGTIFTGTEIGVRVCGTLYLDGELYNHGTPLPVISGIVRRPHDPEGQNDLSYIIYDAFVINKGCATSNGLCFDERNMIIRAIARGAIAARLNAIKFADTYLCRNDPQGATRAIDDARKLYKQFLTEGYEGAIVRTNAPYEHSTNARHTNVLLKIKPIRDAEYTIVDFTVGKRGRADGALLFVCETTDGAHFNITPTGTIESRINLAREFINVESNGKTVFENRWLGRPLIVYFDELSPAGVPQRARTNSEIRTCE